MCTIINFPSRNTSQNTTGYKNLVALFEASESIESCNFYLDTVEMAYNKRHITENEMFTLRRIGRQKRIKLANPVREPEKAEAPGTYCYTPEMGQPKPDGCQIEAQRSYWSGHFDLKTRLELKGRGISKSGSEGGYNWYTATDLAYEKLKKSYAVSFKCPLD